MTKQYSTPGPRAIYPEIADSASLARCGLLANALFPRLIAQADDQGRLPGSAREVQMQCLPHLGYVRTDEVDAALDALQAEHHLLRYEAGGRALVQLITWWRWQSSQRRAYPSRWPAPKGWHDPVYGAWGDGVSSLEEAVDSLPRRNAAIRGNLPRIAARATGADAGACGGRVCRRPRARSARPDLAEGEDVAGATPAPSGAGSRNGPERVGLSDFERLVPRAPATGGTR